MATPSMTPPPGMDQEPGPGPNPPPSEAASPVSAAPAPPQPAPHIQQGTRMAINIVNQLRMIAKAFPGTAPAIAEIHNQMREVMKGIMMQGTPGEPAAPPTGG